MYMEFGHFPFVGTEGEIVHNGNKSDAKIKKHRRYVLYAVIFVILLIITAIFVLASKKAQKEISIIERKVHKIQTDTNFNINPHIIWFVVDDLGHSDFSLHGSEYLTPNIDSLAYKGIELKQHYTSPICSPSRASFISGRFAHTMGLSDLNDVFQPATISHLPSRYLTVANILKTVGYETFAYGKWHLGYSKQSYTPTHRGFDHHYGYYQYSINPFTKHNLKNFKRNGYDWFLDGEVHWEDSNVNLYSTQLLSDKIESDIHSIALSNEDISTAIDFHPMFMYIAFQNPHFPIVTPVDGMYDGYDGECEQIIDMNSHRIRYCRSVKYLDYAIGRVLQSLRDHNIYDNSLVLMATDNGPLILHSCTDQNEFPSAGSLVICIIQTKKR